MDTKETPSPNFKKLSDKFSGPIQELLSPAERSVWGYCKVCGAEPGEKCELEESIYASYEAHFERLSAAPKYRIITFHS